MTEPKPKRVYINFQTDEWSTDSSFYAEFEGPWAKYPLGFGTSSKDACEENEIDFAENANEFVEVRRRVAKELGMKFEISETAEHQLKSLQLTKALCAAEDCEYCS